MIVELIIIILGSIAFLCFLIAIFSLVAPWIKNPTIKLYWLKFERQRLTRIIKARDYRAQLKDVESQIEEIERNR